MMKKYATFLLQLALPLLLLTSVATHAHVADSLLVAPPQEPLKKSEGLYVSGTAIHISKDDSVSVMGDLEMHEASITGSGSVIMKSDRKQKIISTRSSISNLVLQSPRTELEGDLEITAKLTIDGGLFDVSRGSLKIDLNNLLVVNGGEVFWGDQPLFSESNQAAMLLSQQAFSTATTVSATAEAPFLKIIFKDPTYNSLGNFYKLVAQDLPFQPPRSA